MLINIFSDSEMYTHAVSNRLRFFYLLFADYIHNSEHYFTFLYAIWGTGSLMTGKKEYLTCFIQAATRWQTAAGV